MHLETIDTGFFKLDGGAMFGVVPKSIWQNIHPADKNNMCRWAARALLVQTEKRLILIDVGLGNKQSEKFFKHYYRHGEETLHTSLAKRRIAPKDITDVILTHLHFDHCGGAVEYQREKLIPTFKQARYWLHSDHWKWACNPNSREKASFLKENFIPLKEHKQLFFLDKEDFGVNEMSFLFVDGHTEKQTIPIIQYKTKTFAYIADLIPSVFHLPIPYIIAYDVRPLLTLKEKHAFLNTALEKDYILVFEHDPINECCTLQKTSKGIREKNLFSLKDIMKDIM